MSTTAEPPAAPPVEEAAPAAALDRAAGVELLGEVQGSGYKEGAALARRADGQMVHLGPLMYALLEAIDGKRDIGELAAVMSEKLGRGCDEEHVVGLAKKLAQQGLLAGTEENAPEKRNPLLALRWKVLVTNPKATRWLTSPFTVLFRPFVMWPMLAAFLVVCWFVLIHKGVASATAQAFHSPGLLLLVFALAIASAGFHELGHASACRYGGAEPGGMGMGLYMVWPAFYTDVTDSYKLPRRDRLRVDLGGLYFNTVVAVVTMGVWLAWHVDALLLLIALQLLQMVKQLSPMIRADGYHILSDITGVPDLFAHMIPTLRRLIPGRREPSALTGRARLIVTLWVLIVVPVLLSLTIAAIVLLPRLLTTTWDNGRALAAAIPHEAGNGNVLTVFALAMKLLALCLPVLGSILVTQKVLRGLASKANGWSSGHRVRRVVLAGAVAAAACGSAYAMWPSGQYQPIRADQKGTLASFGTLASSPVSVVHPNSRHAGVHLTPGTHLAVSMIPVGGATKAHPAVFIITGKDGEPAVAILSDTAPDLSTAPAADPSGQQTSPGQATTAGGDSQSTPTPVQAAAFPFKLPSAPVKGETQALAVGTKDGGVKYDVAYSLVTVANGAPVTNKNSAYALASCKGCTTVAVSFQVVLIVGTSKLIAPINVAEALNGNCPACVTTAIADQIVVTLKSQPSDALLAQLNDALKQLNALPSLGAGGTPAAVAAAVSAVQQKIDAELKDSGLLANSPAQTTTTQTTTTSTTTTPASTSTTSTSTTPASTTPAATTTTSGSSTSTAETSTTRTTTTPTTTTTATMETTTARQTTTTSTTTTTP